MRILIVNAAQLLTMAGADRPRHGEEMRGLGLVRDGAVLIEDGRILAAGLPELVRSHEGASSAGIIDAGGRVVLPGFVDSHSHPVFAEPRLKDFEARLQGRTYAEIAADGGGILSTVHGVRCASLAQLSDGLRRRAAQFIASGTTTLEAKSGYGLDLDSELKMLRAIKAAAEAGPLEIVATLLGAHALPAEMKHDREEYVRRVCEEMIPAAAREGLAAFVDVFCEKGFFTVAESERIFGAAAKAGLKPKMHAEQLSRSGSLSLARKAGAVSVDHLDRVDESDMGILAGSDMVATLLPGSNYFLAQPYPPARRLIDAGAAVALATDFNPGSCPCWDMRTILSIAATQMRMSPDETLVAATVNGAWAMGLGRTHGSLEAGKVADLVCYEARDYREIPYYFGAAGVAWTMKKGVLVHSRRAHAAR
ncbi:MAG TPA: imidazolonepropionase [Elusimicrobia bacterium]|nr:imidazolonepropionase [Elusimicrobiota bacterium]